MNKKLAVVYRVIVAIVLVISIFPSLIVLAVGSSTAKGADGKDYTYSTEDDGTDGPDVSTLRFELTGYGGHQLGSGKTSSDFTSNSKYGWSELEQDGQKYVVLAAATHEMLSAHKNASGKYWFYGAKFDHIHYFHYNDTIQFKFEDENFDSNVYNGIILDSGDAMMFPQYELYKRDTGLNMFDVYFGENGESASGVSTITQKVVLATTTGTFSSNAGKSNSINKRNLFVELIQKIFQGIGDICEILVNAATGISWKTSKKLTYTRADIEADSKLNDKIQVDDPVSDIDNDETLNADDYNALRTVNIKSTADNRKGQQETIYSANTEIPVMRTDFYGTSIKNIKILDVDFFNTNSSNSNDGWKVIRGFVSGASHIVMYVAAALLLTMIIWRSILFVRSSLGDNPEGAYESRQVMDNFIRAVLLLGCVYLIMTFLYYFYKQMVNILTNGNNSVYLLRLNVEGVYAFNTNVMGYLKYMTMNSNTLAALGASICYAVASIFNLLWFGVMFVRMILIGGLIVIAPLTAVYAMMGRTPSEGVHTGNILNLSNFMTFYSVLLFLPFVVAGIQKIIMLIA